MKKSLSSLINDFENQISEVELRTNPKAKAKLKNVKTLVSKFEQFQMKNINMKGNAVEQR